MKEGLTYREVLSFIKRLLKEDREEALQKLRSVGASETDLPLNIATLIYASPKDILDIFYTYLPRNACAVELLFYSLLQLVEEPWLVKGLMRFRNDYIEGWND